MIYLTNQPSSLLLPCIGSCERRPTRITVRSPLPPLWVSNVLLRAPVRVEPAEHDPVEGFGRLDIREVPHFGDLL